MTDRHMYFPVGLVLAMGLATSTALGAYRSRELQSEEVMRLPHHVYQIDYVEFESLTRLVQVSDVVAQVRFTRRLGSYHQSDEPPLHNATPLRTLIPCSATARLHTELIRTDFQIEVVWPLKGAKLRAGDHLTVTANGGQDAFGSAVSQRELLPVVGSQEVVFLARNMSDGSKHFLVNPQGRFALTTAGTVVPKWNYGPIAREYSGMTLPAFEEAIQAAALSVHR